MHFNKNKAGCGLVITIDDGPIDEHCDNFLAALAEIDLKVYCFVVGKQMEKEPKFTDKMVAAGHILCNHSWSHGHMLEMSKEQQREEIESCSEIIEKHGGYKPEWFRAPYLEYDDELVELVGECGMHSVGCSMYTKDTQLESTPEEIVERLEAAYSEDGIVIGHHWSAATRKALQILVPKWRATNSIGALTLPK